METDTMGPWGGVGAEGVAAEGIGAEGVTQRLLEAIADSVGLLGGRLGSLVGFWRGRSTRVHVGSPDSCLSTVEPSAIRC